MFKYHKVILVLSSLLFFFSCAKNYSPSVTAQSQVETSERYGASEEPNNLFAQDPSNKRFFVPSEIAYMQATINARGNSFSEVAGFVVENAQKLEESIESVAACSTELLEYNHPRRVFNKTIMSGDAIYSSNAVVEITIDFTEAEGIQDRILRVNQCLGAVPELKLANPQKKNTSIDLKLSQVIPTVRDRNAYRQQILERRLAPLREVAQFSNPPSQFDPDGTQCTSNGQVKVKERSLSRIELDIDFQCKQLQ